MPAVLADIPQLETAAGLYNKGNLIFTLIVLKYFILGYESGPAAFLQ